MSACCKYGTELASIMQPGGKATPFVAAGGSMCPMTIAVTVLHWQGPEGVTVCSPAAGSWAPTLPALAAQQTDQTRPLQQPRALL